MKAFEKKPKGTAVKKVDEKSDEDEAGMGLIQRLAKLKREREAMGLPGGSPAAPKPAPKAAPKPAKKDDSDDDMLLLDEEKPKAKPATKSRIIESDEDGV